MTIFILGASSTFCAGGAVALLASYPVPAGSDFVCFVAVFVALAACILAGGAIALHATRSERVRSERVIELTVDQLMRRRGLELVDDE